MKNIFKSAIFLIVAMLAGSSAAAGQSAAFTAIPFVDDELGVGGGNAKWSGNIGVADAVSTTKYGLRFEKTAPLEQLVAAGVVLKGLEGQAIFPGDTLGFDIKIDSPCRGGSPRFNVSYTVGERAGLAFLGCSEGITAATPDPLWQRVTLSLQLPEGAVIESVVLMVDEPGRYVVDNIAFLDLVADTPEHAR